MLKKIRGYNKKIDFKIKIQAFELGIFKIFIIFLII